MSENNPYKAAPQAPFTHQTILDAIPHRPPFLFVDEILEWTDEKISTVYTFKPSEFFFAGHYPKAPLVPGVVLCESAMQAGAVFLSKLFAAEREREIAEGGMGAPKSPVVGRLSEVKFKRMVLPGETIRCDVSLKEKMGSAYFLSAKVTVGGQLAVRFDFACAQTEKS